jgi:hypothetical protein
MKQTAEGVFGSVERVNPELAAVFIWDANEFSSCE